MNLDELQKNTMTWTAHNCPDAESYEPLLGIQEEIGELSHAWLKRKQGIRGTYKEHTEEMSDAIGDLLIYIADFCNKNFLSMQESLDTTWDEVSKRDWRSDPISGKHTGE